jgi:hypothetical protein
LRLGTVGGIDDRRTPSIIFMMRFDFAAEIGMAGSIDNIDVVILVFEGGVLGADGDAFFAFQIMESMMRSSEPAPRWREKSLIASASNHQRCLAMIKWAIIAMLRICSIGSNRPRNVLVCAKGQVLHEVKC